MLIVDPYEIIILIHGKIERLYQECTRSKDETAISFIRNTCTDIINYCNEYKDLRGKEYKNLHKDKI